MFQPLRDLVLIERENVVTEEHRPSGLVVLKSNFSLYNWGQDEMLASDIISKKKQNKGRIVSTGNACTFFKEGDEVIYKKMSEEKYITVDDKECVFVSESNILCKEDQGELVPHPDFVILEISAEHREGLFTKKIVRDDGTTTNLFVYNPAPSDEEGHNARFVSTAKVVRAGKNISDMLVGDIALLNYLLDNDDAVVCGYNGPNKLIAASPKTKYTENEIWVHANRAIEQNPKKDSYGKPLCPKDICVQIKGDYEEMSQILGYIRGDKLFACDPYVFLEHEDSSVHRVSGAGILYSEHLKFFDRKVLSACPDSINRTGVKSGDIVTVDDFDIFDVSFDGKVIHCINDIDIIYNNPL